jgi:hypothetical protein
MSGRFFEDNPVRTLVWLAVVSVVVGFVLVTLNIDPIRVIQDLIGNFDAALAALADLARWIGRNLGRYFLVGVIVVVPLWLIHRLVSLRKGR